MGILKTLMIGIALISFLGVGQNEPEQLRNTTVDTYVEVLKSGKYDASELPAFTYNDIPALLQYRDEQQLIRDFPINSISSLAMPDCTLGMYILWTIESIRAVAIESKYLIGNFPSQNPLIQRKAAPFKIENGNEVHQAVSKAYLDWWENNEDKEFNAFKAIDPLSNTAYRWH